MKNKYLTFILVFISLISLVACSSFNLFDSDYDEDEAEDPEIVDASLQIERILSIISDDDPEALMGWIHPNAIEKYGREQIVERNQIIHTAIGLKNIELKEFDSIGGSQYEGEVSYQGLALYETDYGNIEKSVTYHFIYHPDAERWQLDWTPSVILPGLHDQGLVQIVPLKAKRGNIYDRSGNVLAHKKYINRLGVVPATLQESDIPKIEENFDLPEGFIIKQLEQEWVSQNTFVPIKTIAELTNEQSNQANTFNLMIQQVETRTYPLGPAAAHLIGYVGHPTASDLEKEEYQGFTTEDFIGKSGLEAIYDEQLRGQHGFKVIVTGEYQQVLLEEEAVNGEDFYLTIDSELQEMVYNRCQEQNAALTALDPRNGDILALVSTPSYDPEEFVLGISQSSYDELINNPSNPLFDKFSQAMSPGSTEKILTAIAGFNAGSLSNNTTYNIQGKGWTYDDSWGNYQVIRYTVIDGNMDLTGGIVNSDNIYFARVALDMGIKAFNEQMANLQFNQQISEDYPFGVAQLSNDGDINDTILLADTGYGQGEVLISQAHLSSIYGAVANGGSWYRP
ncbi:MAG TPA: penicillin-binding transpeptidase domain-containing protein, partial [Candidatus Eisenbacteria bacterium]|nr:penicillin-binding transpeptidase domain-containing protein [Candidatus Eisenbacteria bacterium]